MKKITLSLITLMTITTSAVFADGNMEGMDKYNLAYPTLVNDTAGNTSSDSDSSWFGDLFLTEEDEQPGFYVGIGYGSLRINNDTTNEELSSGTIMGQLGYTYNQYIGLEGRYYYGISDPSYSKGTDVSFTGIDATMSAWGIYAKPSFPIGPVKIYGLLGFGSVMLEESIYKTTGSSFQYGGGIQFAFSKSTSFFVDYVKLYDDSDFESSYATNKINSDVISFGVSYKF